MLNAGWRGRHVARWLQRADVTPRDGLPPPVNGQGMPGVYWLLFGAKMRRTKNLNCARSRTLRE
jgi:hypothetical protein